MEMVELVKTLGPWGVLVLVTAWHHWQVRDLRRDVAALKQHVFSIREALIARRIIPAAKLGEIQTKEGGQS